ncbi:MAG: sugar ABC transporter permease [Ardenticatenaceae bacterium]|nr:sugar ABC transporter permease [Ardenticatenaceae bacterium]
MRSWRNSASQAATGTRPATTRVRPGAGLHPRFGWLRTQTSQRYLAALLLSLPALVSLILFNFLPIVETVRFSLNDYNIYTRELAWAGNKQYVVALSDRTLIRSVGTTLQYFALKVPVEMVLALGLALLVRQPGRGVSVLRTIILLPTITSMVVVSTVWGMMYSPNSGLFNSILQSLGLPPQPFLTSPGQALPAVAVITIWKDIGLYMLFYLAGLMNIPTDYYDAARVDGANGLELLRHITVPLLNRTTVFVLVTSTITAFKVFVPVKILTDGGPAGATRVIVLYMFDLAFRYSRFGYAAAVAVLLAAVLLAISLIQYRLTRGR